MVNSYFNSRNLINNEKASVGESCQVGTGKIEVSILTAFVKDPVQFAAPMGMLTITCNYRSRVSNTLFWPLLDAVHVGCT